MELADEIEVVDLPPEELLQRFRDGKVYFPPKAEQAMQRFFRKGNLLGLREMALRYAARKVDEDMRSYMERHGIIGTLACGFEAVGLHQHQSPLRALDSHRSAHGCRPGCGMVCSLCGVSSGDTLHRSRQGPAVT